MNRKQLEISAYSRVSKSPIGLFSRLMPKKSPGMILAYHGVHPRHPNCVHPDLFVKHVDWIKNNFCVGSVDDLISGTSLSEEPMIAITFDDAYSSLMEHALPVLVDSGIPAIVYAPVGYLGKRNEWDHWGAERLMPIMSCEDIQKIHSWGFSIGSHTWNHIRLKNRDSATLNREVVDSKKKLEDLIGDSVNSFAYPHGGKKDMDDNAGIIVREAGYSSAVTTHFGRLDDKRDRFKLRRIIIWPSDSIDIFRLKLSGNFDWLAPKEDILFLMRSGFERWGFL